VRCRPARLHNVRLCRTAGNAPALRRACNRTARLRARCPAPIFAPDFDSYYQT